jgi:excisionase family DNA binding protein
MPGQEKTGGRAMIRNDIPLSEKKFFTYAEFGSIVGVSKTTVYMWVRNGYLKAARFSPRCVMIPRAELERYEKGEMMSGGERKDDK